MRIGIVGCGINGSYLAWKLSKEHDVTVFEKKKKIGKDVCSGLVSERIWNFIPKSEKLIVNVIKEAVLHFSKKDVHLKFYPDMLVLKRKPLDKYVASMAQEAGAKIMLGSEIKRVYNVRGMKPQVKVGGKVHEFDRLIGADGYFSVVRKSVGIRDPKYRLGIYTYVNKKADSQSVDIYPTRNGFSWVIPRKKNLEYGILEEPSVARKMFNSFCKSKRIRPKRIHSYVVPTDLTDAERGKVALCGDVIGLTKPWSGGGILWSMKADDILVKNFPDFRKYDRDLRHYFEPKILFSNFAQWLGKGVANRVPFLAPKEVSFDSDWIF
ncbi:MAG: NAD(P)-binding protein [Candidatus Aenigmatarchaeota archaeon]